MPVLLLWAATLGCSPVNARTPPDAGPARQASATEEPVSIHNALTACLDVVPTGVRHQPKHDGGAIGHLAVGIYHEGEVALAGGSRVETAEGAFVLHRWPPRDLDRFDDAVRHQRRFAAALCSERLDVNARIQHEEVVVTDCRRASA